MSERKRRVGLFIVLALVISIGPLLAFNYLSSYVERQFIGSAAIESFVPVYIIYDPPGGGSFSELSTSGDYPIIASFSSRSENQVVKGACDAISVSVTVAGPKEQRAHFMVAVKLNLTWDVWHCYSGESEWFEVVLNSTSYEKGIGLISFDNLAQYHLWVEDLTGTAGPFMYEVDIAHNETHILELRYSRHQFVDIRAGFTMTIFGIDFSVCVFINTGSKTIQFTHTYFDAEEDLSFCLESYGFLRNLYSNNMQIENLLVWFSL